MAIEPPELETRVAILMSKAQQMQITLPHEVAFFVAKRIRSNVRELEGALRRVVANARFMAKPITVDFAKEALRDLLALQDKQVTIENIQKTVAEYFKIRGADLLSKRRNRSVWTAPTSGTKWKYTPWLPTCPVHLKPEVPVEPIVIRAAAGDCINVTLRNKTLEQAVTKIGNWPIYNDLGKPVFLDLGDKSKGLNADTNGDGKGDKAVTRNEGAFDSRPDLAVPNPLPAMVRLNRGDDQQGMTSVQSTLLTPSPFVGLHPALVEYDVTIDRTGRKSGKITASVRKLRDRANR